MLSLKPRSFVQLLVVVRYAWVPTATRVSSFFLYFFVFLFSEVSLFYIFFVLIPFFSLHGEYVARFPLPDGVFLPGDQGLDF